MMKAGLYVRVSTSNGQTTENQLRELKTYCERQQWKIAEVYDDTGLSGSKADRPALQKMLRDAEAGRFKVAVCWKIDRLARSTVDLLNILTRLKNCGVEFVSTTQAIDTTSSYGKMVMTFLGAIAEFERDTIIERVRSGLSRAKANGVRLGRPRIGFDIGKAIALKKQGLGVRKIAKELGMNYGTVYRYLKTVTKTPA